MAAARNMNAVVPLKRENVEPLESGMQTLISYGDRS
jgi:hypothetical protein